MAAAPTFAPGTFCWADLASPDPHRTEAFYHHVFGWHQEDRSVAPDVFYAVFTLDGAAVAGHYKLQPQLEEQGVPPNWSIYVASADVDADTKRAVDLGGGIVEPPVDAHTFGRMSVLRDPTGAVFAIWKAEESPGFGVTNKTNAFCWAE